VYFLKDALCRGATFVFSSRKRGREALAISTTVKVCKQPKKKKKKGKECFAFSVFPGRFETIFMEFFLPV
jgi:hypothetical protein